MKLKLAAKKNQDTVFYVFSDSGTKYTVYHKRDKTKHRRVWTCNCPSFTNRLMFDGLLCKHIDFVINEKAKLSTVVHNWPVDYPAAPVSANKPTAKQVLKDIVAVLEDKTNKDMRHFWMILSILRGPDDSDSELKMKTVACIRNILGLTDDKFNTPFVTSSDDPLGVNFISEWQIEEEIKKYFPKSTFHFRTHYVQAITGLRYFGYIKQEA